MDGIQLGLRLQASAYNRLDVARNVGASERAVQQVLSKNLPVPASWAPSLRHLSLIDSEELDVLSRTRSAIDGAWLRRERVRLKLTEYQVAAIVAPVDPLLRIVKTTIEIIEEARVPVPSKWMPPLRAAGFADADPAVLPTTQEGGSPASGSDSMPQFSKYRDFSLSVDLNARFTGSPDNPSVMLLDQDGKPITLLRFEGVRWVVELQRPTNAEVDPVLVPPLEQARKAWQSAPRA